jgi:hypothetical protein
VRRVVVVGNPGHKRVKLFQDALARRGWPPAEVVSWFDLLTGRDRFDAVAAGVLVRLESPGQDFKVEKQLIARGAEEPESEDTGAESITADASLELPFEKGRILYPRQWYRGFRAVLRSLATRPGVLWLNHPIEVIDLFDKRRCQDRLAGEGVPIPARLGAVRSYEELVARMRELGRLRVFVKLACGSSGSGVVAFALGRDRVQATTTVELVRRDGQWLMFNSRRLRRYESIGEVTALFDTLCREGVQVEEWVPKAGLRDRSCDLRVLMIAGREAHTVVRLSHSPLTNLHLLNDRTDAEELRAVVPQEAWDKAMADCRRTAGVFAGCLHVGVDMVFTPSFRRHAIVEANAFGDLLPGTHWNGLDTYGAELAALERETHR